MKAVIILSGGNGTRMKSTTPKVLHTIAGKSLLQWVVDTVNTLNPEQIIIVTSPSLKLEDLSEKVDVVVQKVPKGTGDALQTAMTKLRHDINRVLLVCGDTPLLNPSDLENLSNTKADLAVAGMQIDDLSKDYGRIEIDNSNNPLKIIETKHNESAKTNKLANAGAYSFDVKMLQNLLPMLNPNLESGELYATDLVELAQSKGYTAKLILADEENFLGINTIVELTNAEKIMQFRIKNKFMLNGVRFVLPETTYVNYDAEIGTGTIIEPNVYIGANVHISSNAKILSYSYLNDCIVHADASVGPFAHLRGKSVIDEGASIGNFVEVKNSTIGKKAKAKHLSYIGDALVGAGSNIGAGTITCNYNGFDKFKTNIGKNVMVGANTTLIAPINVSDGAYIAAGSVITKNVTSDSLAISRTQQQEKIGWALKFRASQKS